METVNDNKEGKDMMKNEKYAIRCAETGDIIDTFDTIDEAKKELAYYVKQDVLEDVSETEESAELFYEIYDNENEQIL